MRKGERDEHSRHDARAVISVVSPTLNQRPFLPQAISSVASQRDWVAEHIILDGASTDGTVEYLQETDHTPGLEHIKWWSERDNGPANAINKGFRAASGSIVGWLNTDDYYLPGALEAVVTAFEENPTLDVIYGEAMFVDESGQCIRVKRDHAFDASILLYYGCYIMSTATFLRRQVIDQGQFLDTQFRVTMDFEYFVRLARNEYRFGFIPQTLAAFRWHDTNVSVLNESWRRRERRSVQQLPWAFAGLGLSVALSTSSKSGFQPTVS